MLHLAQDALPTFDLSYVKERIMKRDKWTPKALDLAEKHYREFMAQVKANPHESHSPSVLADTIWHEHILFTREYARDMQNYVGHYVHHIPLDADPDSTINDLCTDSDGLLTAARCSQKCKECCTSGGDSACTSLVPAMRGDVPKEASGEGDGACIVCASYSRDYVTRRLLST